jgi:hypothetical protein
MVILPARLVTRNGERNNEPILTHYQFIWLYRPPNNTTRNGDWRSLILFANIRRHNIIPHEGK